MEPPSVSPNSITASDSSQCPQQCLCFSPWTACAASSQNALLCERVNPGRTRLYAWLQLQHCNLGAITKPQGSGNSVKSTDPQGPDLLLGPPAMIPDPRPPASALGGHKDHRAMLPETVCQSVGVKESLQTLWIVTPPSFSCKAGQPWRHHAVASCCPGTQTGFAGLFCLFSAQAGKGLDPHGPGKVSP